MAGLIFIFGVLVGCIVGGACLMSYTESKYSEMMKNDVRLAQRLIDEQYKLGFEIGAKQHKNADFEWISVKDKLPEPEYRDCLLVLKVGDSYVIDCGGWTKTIGWDENRNEVESWGWWVNNDWDEGQGCIVHVRPNTMSLIIYRRVSLNVGHVGCKSLPTYKNENL